MGSLIKDFLAFRRPVKAERVRSKINKINEKKRKLTEEALALTREAEKLEGAKGATSNPHFMRKRG